MPTANVQVACGTKTAALPSASVAPRIRAPSPQSPLTAAFGMLVMSTWLSAACMTAPPTRLSMTCMRPWSMLAIVSVGLWYSGSAAMLPSRVPVQPVVGVR